MKIFHKILKKVLTLVFICVNMYLTKGHDVSYKTIQTKGFLKMRKEIYEELIGLGYTSEEAWEQISEMEFADDYEWGV